MPSREMTSESSKPDAIDLSSPAHMEVSDSVPVNDEAIAKASSGAAVDHSQAVESAGPASQGTEGTDLPDSLLPLLPEDAPADHEAHTIVRWDTGKWPFAWFWSDTDPGKVKVKIQVTIHACGTQEVCMRIAKHLYVKKLAGLGSVEIKKHREQLYTGIKKARAAMAQGLEANLIRSDIAENGAEVADSAPNGQLIGEGAGGEKRKSDSTPLEEEREKKKPKEAKEKTPKSDAKDGKLARRASEDKAPPPAAPDAPDAVPDDAYVISLLPPITSKVAAEHKISRQAHPKPLYYFEYFGGGGRERLQTTVHRSGHSKGAAEHIARLCIEKFETKCSRQEVIDFREEMYKIVEAAISTGEVPMTAAPPEAFSTKRPNGAGSAKAAAAASAKIDDIRNKLQAEGRLEGALRLEGRAETSKNASINGIYARLSEGFEGTKAYEKADGSVGRMLFYSTRKARWKINDSLDDSTGGFAFAKVKDKGESDPGPSLRWSVFDGSGKGYNEDTRIRCSPLGGAAPAPPGGAVDPVEEGAAVEPEGAEGAEGQQGAPVGKAEEGAPAGKAKEDESSESDSDSDSSSSESAPKAALAPSPAASPAASPVPNGAAASPAASVPAPQTPPSQPVRRPRRVCAKMLVKSGFRCTAHFAILTQCPQCKAG